MQWLINRVNEGKMETIIAKTGAKKGSIVIPTGGGKSGVVYEDIIYHIQEHLSRKDDEKVIFNLSAPILDLEAQFINDLFDCLKEVFSDEVKSGKFMFFVNSTADGDAYKSEYMHCDVNRYTEIERFEKHPTAKFAFVASCHKSLYRFAESMDYINSFAEVVSYLDESHLLINESRDDVKEDELSKEETKKKETLVEIFEKSDYVYTLTATESIYINTLINKYAGFEPTHHIINISAKELIDKNVILPLRAYTQETNEGITVDMCVRFMEMVKEDNPYIHHKVLVTCHKTDHLVEMEEALNRLGYKVFSTCSREGSKTNDEEKSFEELDKINFISNIDNYEGDCFVLHIKRLRQGIDIKSLTDVVFYNSTRVNDGVKRTTLQTLGRALRTAAGERGVYIEYREKKYGNALLVIGKKDFETVSRQMANLLIGYYGRKGVSVFRDADDVEKGYGETGKTHTFLIGSSIEEYGRFDIVKISINNLKANIKKYIIENLYSTYNMYKKRDEKLTFEKFVESRMGELKEKFLVYDREIDMSELLSNDELMEYVDVVLKEIEY